MGSTDSNPFRYCCEYYDYETDTYYLRARYYSSSRGSFLTEDPIGDGLNWYVYCGNSPVNFIDPFGLEKIVVSGGSDGAENFVYNFIETAIKQIVDWQALSDEAIAWIIANWNYSEQDLLNYQDVAN